MNVDGGKQRRLLPTRGKPSGRYAGTGDPSWSPDAERSSSHTGTVSTTIASCPVFLNSGPSFANWDAFAAAQPAYTISGSYPFVIADVGTAAPIVLYDVSVTK
jgi:hypothetical protein